MRSCHSGLPIMGLALKFEAASPKSGTALLENRITSFMLVAPMSCRNSGVSTETAAPVSMRFVLSRLPARVFWAR